MEMGLARSEMCAAGFYIDDRPWLIHAANNLERDGMYSDYTGWESWITEQMGNSEEAYWFEDLDHIEQIMFYAEHCDMVTTLEGD